MTLPLIRTCGAVIRIQVLNYDSIGAHTLLGWCEIPVSSLPSSPPDKDVPYLIDNWYELEMPRTVKYGFGKRRVKPAVPMEEVGGDESKKKGIGESTAS